VVAVWKKLLPVPFVILAVVVLYVGLRRSAPSTPPVASSAPSGEASAAPPADSGDKVVLTKKEREEISVPISHEKCGELQERVTQMPDPPPGDPRALRFLAACMRHGNAAWYRCASVATTRAEMNACSRRLLHNELAP
jgi:hypothetical protein